MLPCAVVFSILVVGSQCLEFPKHFKFGAATAAYQVEGAWNVSDKGESIWDHFVHTKPELIRDLANGDVACDSYHLWRSDVQIAKELGLDFYRFSISWPRLLPEGLATKISEDGKRYYNDLIDELIKNDIEPLVTIYHWDLPQRLQNLGGWTNPLITEWFADYARVVYTLFGDRVKRFLTINEPIAVCEASYNMGVLAPGLKDPDFGNYICSKNVIVAHAKAWRIYDEEFRHKFGGKVSLANQLIWFEPQSPEHEELTELTRQYYNSRYIHPIFTKEGGWPRELEKVVAENSKKQGLSWSRLPAFTEEEIKLVRGTYDFFAVNYYTSRLVSRSGDKPPGFLDLNIGEIGAVLVVDNEWEPAFEGAWIYKTPTAVRKQLAWLHQYNPDMQILITEIGLSSEEVPNTNDYDRVENMRDNLEQVLLSIEEDGVDVIGFTAWTMIDNFEWMDGYHTRFGIYEVDFTDPKRKRTPKKSAHYYKHVIKTRSIDIPFKDEL